VASGDLGAKAAASDVAAQVDTAFDRLTEVDGRLGASLQFTPEGLASRKREHHRRCTSSARWKRSWERGKARGVKKAEVAEGAEGVAGGLRRAA
jgi:hypothetical protein